MAKQKWPRRRGRQTRMRTNIANRRKQQRFRKLQVQNLKKLSSSNTGM